MLNRFLILMLMYFSITVFSFAEESLLNTNEVKVAKAVAAMAVGEGDAKTEAEEAAVVAETVQRAEKDKKSGKSKKADPWDAFSPPPDSEFDWIQLTSGEWLKGDFKVLYDYVVEFDSDELDLQEFDLEDVKRMRTRNMKTIFIQGEDGTRDTSILRGVLELDENNVTLRRSEHEIVVPRSRVISIADGKQRERDYWSGMASIGVNMRGGNTETTDTTVMANLKRRTAKSRFQADYLANYSYSAEKETANNQRLSGFFDRFLTAKFYAQILSGEYYRDPFSNIDRQFSLGTGLGYDVVHNSKTEWTLGPGVGYQHKKFVSVEAGETDHSESPFFTFGTRFDHEVSGNLDFLVDYNLRWLNQDNGQYTHHMLTTFSFDLISDLDLDVSFIWDRIEKPQADEDGATPKQDDYQLVVSLAYDF